MTSSTTVDLALCTWDEILLPRNTFCTRGWRPWKHSGLGFCSSRFKVDAMKILEFYCTEWWLCRDFCVGLRMSFLEEKESKSREKYNCWIAVENSLLSFIGGCNQESFQLYIFLRPPRNSLWHCLCTKNPRTHEKYWNMRRKKIYIFMHLCVNFCVFAGNKNHCGCHAPLLVDIVIKKRRSSLLPQVSFHVPFCLQITSFSPQKLVAKKRYLNASLWTHTWHSLNFGNLVHCGIDFLCF